MSLSIRCTVSEGIEIRVLPRKNPQSDTRFDKVCHIAELSCHVQKWQDISWLDVPSKKEAKKRGEKRRGKNDGGK